MIVTGIEELSKSRSRIFLDGEFAFVLYKGELRSYHVRLGEELAREDYDKICQEVLPKRAKLRAMNLLMKRDYTTAQLSDKLTRGGYSSEMAKVAVDYVDSFHYTDDLRYAVDYITYHQQSRSRMRIEQDLYRKGIDRDTLEKAWLQWEEQGGRQDEDAMIEELLRKRGFSSDTATMAQRQKEYGFLMRKGFSGDRVKRAVFQDSFT